MPLKNCCSPKNNDMWDDSRAVWVNVLPWDRREDGRLPTRARATGRSPPGVALEGQQPSDVRLLLTGLSRPESRMKLGSERLWLTADDRQGEPESRPAVAGTWQEPGEPLVGHRQRDCASGRQSRGQIGFARGGCLPGSGPAGGTSAAVGLSGWVPGTMWVGSRRKRPQ